MGKLSKEPHFAHFMWFLHISEQVDDCCVCVSITSFKREKTVGKSDSSYTHTNTHAFPAPPPPAPPQDFDLNSTAGVGGGVAAWGLHWVTCTPFSSARLPGDP